MRVAGPIAWPVAAGSNLNEAALAYRPRAPRQRGPATGPGPSARWMT